MPSLDGIPWVEKYRPKSVDDVAHQKEVVSTLKTAIDCGNLPHLLFYGPPGTGKTSTILALARELYGPELLKTRVLELNASDDRGIHIIRKKVKTFAQGTVGENGLGNPNAPPFKLIILDEADSMTEEAQGALRRTMETYSKATRFCIICNYVSRIITPLTSRCTKFRFQPVERVSMVDRLGMICDAEGIQKSDDLMESLIRVSEGDMRKAITMLQSAYRLYGEENVTGESVTEVSCTLPPNVVEEIVSACKSSNFDRVEKKIDETLKLGYASNEIISQLTSWCVQSNDFENDLFKSHAAERLAKADLALRDGADEYLQLLDVSSFIMSMLCSRGLPQS